MKRIAKESDVFVGEYFTHLRKDHLYTQAQLSDVLGLSRITYCCYEKGTRSLPLSLMKKLCTLYHMDFYKTFIYLDKELTKKGLTMYE